MASHGPFELMLVLEKIKLLTKSEIETPATMAAASIVLAVLSSSWIETILESPLMQTGLGLPHAGRKSLWFNIHHSTSAIDNKLLNE